MSEATSYHPRLADSRLIELFDEFPAVMITGARAIGKTSSAAQVAGSIVRLDVPGQAAAFRADPDAALRRAARPVLLDEWQEVPQVLPAVKRAVDRESSPGQFILTGSVRAELSHETWAGTGRIVRMNMYPLAERELQDPSSLAPTSFLDRLATTGVDDLAVPSEPLVIDDYVARAVRGGFPEVVFRDRGEQARATWMESYVDDIVTRDAAMLDGHKDPVKLRRYFTALAVNNSGMPSDATMFRAADVNVKTAASYDRLLENLFMIDTVPAWSTNRLSRLTRRPKRYVIDCGMAAAAAGLDARSILDDGDYLGRTFDAFAAAQLRAEVALNERRIRFHHLRVEGGRREIDLVAEMGGSQVVALEFKAGSAPDEHDARHLAWLRDQLGQDFRAGAVVHSGPAIYELGERIYAVPLSAIWS